MSRIAYTLVMIFAVAYLLLVAGCVPDASAHSSRQHPRYEQDWHRSWQRSVPKKPRYRWRREKSQMPRKTAQEDRGMRWHGYRSE
jgi:hypothetical protein